MLFIPFFGGGGGVFPWFAEAGRQMKCGSLGPQGLAARRFLEQGLPMSSNVRWRLPGAWVQLTAELERWEAPDADATSFPLVRIAAGVGASEDGAERAGHQGNGPAAVAAAASEAASPPRAPDGSVSSTADAAGGPAAAGEPMDVVDGGEHVAVGGPAAAERPAAVAADSKAGAGPVLAGPEAREGVEAPAPGGDKPDGEGDVFAKGCSCRWCIFKHRHWQQRMPSARAPRGLPRVADERLLRHSALRCLSGRICLACTQGLLAPPWTLEVGVAPGAWLPFMWPRPPDR
jgi:hypothetical protein